MPEGSPALHVILLGEVAAVVGDRHVPLGSGSSAQFLARLALAGSPVEVGSFGREGRNGWSVLRRDLGRDGALLVLSSPRGHRSLAPHVTVDVRDFRLEIERAEAAFREGMPIELDVVTGLLETGTKEFAPGLKSCGIRMEDGKKFPDEWFDHERGRHRSDVGEFFQDAITWALERDDRLTVGLWLRKFELFDGRCGGGTGFVEMRDLVRAEFARRDGRHPVGPPVDPGSARGPRLPLYSIRVPDIHDRFTGRDRELAELRRKLEDPASRWCVVHALGGTGKTRLVAQYAWLSRFGYQLVWWIRGENSAQLRSDLVSLARRLGLPHAFADDESGALRRLVLEELQDWLGTPEAGPWLVVIDNATGVGELQNLFPHVPENGRIVVTSVNPDWHGLDPEPIHLGTLTLDASIELFRRRAQLRGEDDVIREICAELGCLPLALGQAAATVAEDHISPQDYLARLRSREGHAMFARWPRDLEKTEVTVAETWRLAIEGAANRHAGAPALLEVVAFMGGEPISDRLLEAGRSALPDELRDPGAVHAAWVALKKYSLVEPDNFDGFTVHRVLQRVVRGSIEGEPGRIEARLGSAVACVLAALPTDPVHDTTSVPDEPIVAHAAMVIERARQYGEHLVDAARIASLRGLYLRSRADWTGALESHELALDLARDLAPPEVEGVLRTRRANALRGLASFDEAKSEIDAAIRLLEHGDHQQLARALTVKARLAARPDSDLAGAVALLGQVLEMQEQTSAPARDLSRTMLYLAKFVRQLDRIDEARAHALAGLARLGVEYRDGRIVGGSARDMLVVDHLRCLGLILRDAGELVGALAAHEVVLATRTEMLGGRHSDVGEANDSLGRVQLDLGCLDRALCSFRLAEDIAQSAFGPRYPHVATSFVNQAVVHRELGDLDASDALLEDAQRIYGKAYVTGNLDHAWALLQLALTALARGDAESVERAADLIERADESRRAKLPVGHRQHATTLHARGDLAHVRGEFPAAAELHRQALAIREGGLPVGHPLLADSHERLGRALAAALDTPAALSAYRVAETIRASVMPPDSHWLRRVRSKLAELAPA